MVSFLAGDWITFEQFLIDASTKIGDYRKILQNHVPKLISSKLQKQTKFRLSDTIIDFQKEIENFFSSFFSHSRQLSFHSPMRDVEKTKRSEKSLQPYRFLLNEPMNEKLKTINQLITTWVNEKNDDSLSIFLQNIKWSLRGEFMRVASVLAWLTQWRITFD